MAGIAPPRLHVVLLGGFRLEREGQAMPGPIVWARPGARTLVKLLALTPGHRLHREQLLERLWPDLSPGAALNAFRKTLHLARLAIEPERSPGTASAYLDLEEQVVGLNASTVSIDVDRFERLAEAALASDDVPAFEHALAAYHGELLPEDRYAEWSTERREALAERRRRLLFRLATRLETDGALARAVDHLRELLVDDPTREEAQRRLMHLLLRLGRRDEALRQYRTCREVLRRALDVEPDARTEELHRAIRAAAIPPAGSSGGPTRVGTLAGSPLPAPVQQHVTADMVGRERPLQVLLAALARASDRRPEETPLDGTGLVLVSGEAGVGKTRLVAEVAREASRRGGLVLWGASYEQDGPLPYGPFVEAFESCLASTGRQPKKLAPVAPELARLLPSLAIEEATPWHLETDHETERSRLFAAMVRLLEHLAGGRPVLLVLDDLHAADPSSLALLQHLARLAADRRWLILATCREDESPRGSAFRRATNALLHGQLCRRVELLRLARPDCDRLVRSLLPGAVEPALLDWVDRSALGNPLFVVQLVGDLQEQGHLIRVDDCWRAPRDHPTVPRRVQDLVAGRVDRLGDAVRRVLELAAVAGQEFSFAEVREVARASLNPPLAEGALLDALERAVEAQLLAEHEQGYAFQHPLVRSALYQGVSRRRRSFLHAAFAEAIERQRPDDVEALAFHWGQSERDDRAIIYLARAGDRARALYAHEVAETVYRELIERLDRQGVARERIRGRMTLGFLLRVLGRYEDALAVLDQAAALGQQAADPEALGWVMLQIGLVHRAQGTLDDGLARVHTVLEPPPSERPPPVTAAAHLVVSLLRFAGGDYAASLTAADRSIEEATRVDPAEQRDRILAAGNASRGQALLHLGRWRGTRDVLEQAVLRAGPLDDFESSRVALSALGFGTIVQGDLDQGQVYLERGLAWAERTGDRSWIAYAWAFRGLVSLLRGDWPRARADLASTGEPVEVPVPSWRAAYAPLFLGQLRWAEGQSDEAARCLDDADALAQRGHNPVARALAQCLLAERDLREGHLETARSRLEPFRDDTTLASLLSRSHLAWALLEGGEPTAATDLVAQAITWARHEGFGLVLVDALRVQALILRRLGCWPDAAAAAAESVSLARCLGLPYAEAGALEELGPALAGQGEPARARESLEAAHRIFRRLGARRDAEDAERLLGSEIPIAE